MNTWYDKSFEDISQMLETNLDHGLSSEEARDRLQEYGENSLKEGKGVSVFELFLNQFRDVLVIILLLAALISGLLGEITDTVVISIILILNATLGVVQEYRAEKSLAALKEMTAPEAIVLRDGRQQKIEAAGLVPGDIVLLEAGNYIPADLRLFSVSDLKIEESVLTGESVSVDKETEPLEGKNPGPGDQKNMAFMGTVVAYGRGEGIVTATGMETEMGQIAGMLDSGKREPTPLQKRIDSMGKKLGVLTLLIVAFVIIAGLLRDIEFFDIFMTGISLAVAAVPEGLPAVVTIVLALGVQRMIKKHAIIRRLPAVETLGATTVICSDKTGTLTRNQMTVTRIYLPEEIIEVEGEGYKPEGEFRTADSKIDIEARKDLKLLLRAGVLCNNAELINEGQEWKIIGDPTEGSLLVAAEKAGLQKSLLEEEYCRIKELPFDSKRKRMSTINQQQGEITAYVKGAPDGLLEICDRIYRNGEIRKLKPEEKERILEINSVFAREALRVLAFACKPLSSSSEKINDSENLVVDEVEQGLVFLGLMGMIDPPRREVADSVQTCKKAGIRPVMITGDYALTARAIAEELGIYQSGERVVSGAELAEMTDPELEEAVQQTVVFARVSPAHKGRIVEALQKKGEIVAMTGDGVNDAPALKKADIGVAMGITGTDVSKGAADMVLTDDNFSSIVAAVGEGRAIYENIKKFIRFLLSCNTGEIMLIFTAIALGLPVPLLPAQILWVNLVTDGLPALALGVDPAAEDLMQRSPRDPDEGIFAGKMGFNILSQGIFIGIINLLVFYYGLTFFSLAAARTMVFAALSFSQLSQALNSRSNRYSLRKIGVLSNRYLVMALCASGLLQLAVMFLPFLQGFFRVVSLNGAQWFVLFFSAILPLFFAELIKKMGFSYRKK